MTNFATIQVREQLSLGCLMAIYWDALVNATGGADQAEYAVMYGPAEYMERGQVQSRVREWLGWYGSRSVECGPRTEYTNDATERIIRAVVAKAYRLTY